MTISVLGSTGSIGRQTLEVAEHLGLRVVALATGHKSELFDAQVKKFQPQMSATFEVDGVDGVCECATYGDMVVSAISGFAGLKPAITALEHGKRLALANKETLVAAGNIIMPLAGESGLIPVDSEHSAIFQCLQGSHKSELQSIILTASGGAFRGYSPEQLAQVTVADALRHPNWNMGAKITIDSATLMNKGLELIEAMHLFGVSPQQIEIVVHPQSVVHSAVRFKDGAIIAQLGTPDMRLPIQYALTYPERVHGLGEPLDLLKIRELTFEPPDLQNFPCLRMAIECASLGTAACVVLNAANEVAVGNFLAKQCNFSDIPHIISNALEKFADRHAETIDEIIDLDLNVRKELQELR